MKKCELTRRLLSRFLDSLDDPFSSKLSTFFRKGEDAKVVELLASRQGFDMKQSIESYLGWSVLSKYQHFEVPDLKAENALKKFHLAEERCKATNNRLRSSRVWAHNPDLRQILYLAQRNCDTILGPFNWDLVAESSSFGPGACFGLPRRSATPRGKLDWLKPTVTHGSYDLATCFLKVAPGWGRYLGSRGGSLHQVAGNRIVTVPKSSTTDRIIAIEPLFNVLLQKGVGSIIRSRLKKVGCNLNDQTINRNLALASSKDGRFSTIDLSMASDTLSKALVELIVPNGWLEALELLRCPSGTLPSREIVYYEKFSSMGNGYTFELESLIFLSILRAVCQFYGMRDTSISVYGDDIIIPVEWTDVAIQTLAFFGFATNEGKSFCSGYFRESCGLHAANGRDITPLYVKSNVRGAERLLWFANSVKRLAFRLRGTGYSLDSRFRSLYQEIVEAIPPRFRVPIPEGYGDGGLVTDFDECCPKPLPSRKGWEGFELRPWQRFYRTNGKATLGSVLDSLWSLERSSEISEWSERLERYSFSRKKSPSVVRQWQDLGPFL